MGSLSSWSDAYKSTIDNDDAFLHSSKQHHLNHHSSLSHHSTLSHIPKQFSQIFSFSQPSTLPHISTKLSLQSNTTSNKSSTKVSFPKKNRSLDRHSGDKSWDFEALHKNHSNNNNNNSMLNQSPRKRVSSTKRDFFNNSPMDLPASLKPLPNGFIPAFQDELNHSQSSPLSLKSNQHQNTSCTSIKSNQLPNTSFHAYKQQMPSHTSTISNLSQNFKFSPPNPTLSPPHSQISSLNFQFDSPNDNKTRLRRRRYSNVRQSKQASNNNNDNSNNTSNSFQSIDMITFRKGNNNKITNFNKNTSNNNISNNNTSSQESDILQQPRQIFSIDQHTTSIRPSPHHMQASSHYQTSEEAFKRTNKDIKSSVSEVSSKIFSH